MSWPQQVFFRTDASYQIGSGHVMRCLTLARALTEGGSSCSFICRNLVGNMIDFIRSWDFQVHILPKEDWASYNNSQLAHASWLGSTWQNDSQQCKEILGDRKIDLLVVDSYALDHEWEKSLKENFARILVIDDLKDRSHCCDFLLDQTYGRKSREYDNLVPEACEVFCGSEFAILRKEFSQLRDQSLKRQQFNDSQKLLISMGGVDRENFTGKLLEKLEELGTFNFDISVVLSTQAPHYHSVKKQILVSEMNVELLSDVSDMASLMAVHDIAIGAAGSSAWERCCLGLPTIIMILAENQKVIAQSLVDAGASLLYDFERGPELDKCLNKLLKNRRAFSTAASKVCTGKGCPELVKKMKQMAYAN